MPPESPTTNEQYFDGNQISPQFAIALKNFILANASSSVKYAVGNASYDASTASGSQTIAHGLGKKPSYLRITAQLVAAKVYEWSFGGYNGTTTKAIYGYQDGTNGASTTTNDLIVITNQAGDEQIATATLDATNINITWTKVGSPTGHIYFLWEVS